MDVNNPIRIHEHDGALWQLFERLTGNDPQHSVRTPVQEMLRIRQNHAQFDILLKDVDFQRALITFDDRLRSLIALPANMLHEPQTFAVDNKVNDVLLVVGKQWAQVLDGADWLDISKTMRAAYATNGRDYGIAFALLQCYVHYSNLATTVTQVRQDRAIVVMCDGLIAPGAVFLPREVWATLSILRHFAPPWLLSKPPKTDDADETIELFKRHEQLIEVFFLGNDDATAQRFWPLPEMATTASRLQQRKTWARAFGVWDFGLDHTMLMINNQSLLQSLLQRSDLEEFKAAGGGVADSFADTVETLVECLTKYDEREKDRHAFELDGLVTILSQARRWDNDTTRTVYLTPSLAHLFWLWLLQPEDKRDRAPPDDPHFGFLISFFNGADERWQKTLVLLPVLMHRSDVNRGSIGHWVLSVFWWEDRAARLLGYAFYDSLWQSEREIRDGPEGKSRLTLFQEEHVATLLDVWGMQLAKYSPQRDVRPLMAIPLTYESRGLKMKQDNAECGANVLYEMDFLCHKGLDDLPGVRAGRMRSPFATETTLGLELSVTRAMNTWVLRELRVQPPSATQPRASLGWSLQLQFLRGLQQLQPIAHADLNNTLPLFETTEHALHVGASAVLLGAFWPNGHRQVAAAWLEALRPTRRVEWTNYLQHPFPVLSDATAERDMVEAYTHLRLTDDQALRIPVAPWSPSYNTMAARVYLSTVSPTGGVGGFLRQWIVHIYEQPVWPKRTPAEQAAVRRGYDAALIPDWLVTINGPVLEAVLNENGKLAQIALDATRPAVVVPSPTPAPAPVPVVVAPGPRPATPPPPAVVIPSLPRSRSPSPSPRSRSPSPTPASGPSTPRRSRSPSPSPGRAPPPAFVPLPIVPPAPAPRFVPPAVHIPRAVPLRPILPATPELSLDEEREQLMDPEVVRRGAHLERNTLERYENPAARGYQPPWVQPSSNMVAGPGQAEADWALSVNSFSPAYRDELLAISYERQSALFDQAKRRQHARAYWEEITEGLRGHF